MRVVGSLLISVGAGLGGAAWSPPARAETPASRRDAAAADLLFERAKEQLKQGNWSGACGNFEASMKLDASVSTQIKIARCREHENQFLAAWLAYETALELNQHLPQAPERVRELDRSIRTELAVLSPHLSRVRLVILPRTAKAKLLLNGQPPVVDPADGALMLEEGEAELTATAEGYAPQTVRLLAKAGTLQDLGLELQPLAPTQAAPVSPAPVSVAPASAPRLAPSPASAAQGRSWSYWVGGAGLATLGMAGYFGLRTLSLVRQSRGHCDPPDSCSPEGVAIIGRAKTAQTTGLILAGAGGLLLGTAVILYSGSSSSAAGARSAPLLSARISASTVTLTGSF